MAPAALLLCTLLHTPTPTHTQIPLLSLLQENDYHLVPRTSQPAFSLSPLLHRRLFYCRSLSFFFPASRSLFRSLIRWSFFKLRQFGRRSLCFLPSLHLLLLILLFILLLRHLFLSWQKKKERKHSVVSSERERTRYKFIDSCVVFFAFGTFHYFRSALPKSEANKDTPRGGSVARILLFCGGLAVRDLVFCTEDGINTAAKTNRLGP